MEPQPATSIPPDLAQRIQSARAAGMSDDDIVGAMAQHPAMGSKVQQAQQSGIASHDIVEAMASGPGNMPPQGPPQGFGSYLKQVGSGALGAVKGAADLIGSAYNPSQSMQVGQSIVQPMHEQAQKAKQSFNQGDYSEAFGHGLAAALPGVGPAAANIGEKLGNQDYTGAAADATVLGGTMALPHAGGAAAGAIGDAFRLDPEVAAERAWRPNPAGFPNFPNPPRKRVATCQNVCEILVCTGIMLTLYLLQHRLTLSLLLQQRHGSLPTTR